jgi:hypothetical protein
VFLRFFLVVVECGFCWGFCENGCAERGFLRGKRGEVVVKCVAGIDSKRLGEIGTAFLHICEFIFHAGDSRPVPG